MSVRKHDRSIIIISAFQTFRDDNGNDTIKSKPKAGNIVHSSKSLSTILPSGISPKLIAEAKRLPVGDAIATVQQTIHDVIEAHLVTNIHTAESVKRGIVLCEQINKENAVKLNLIQCFVIV